MGSYGKKSLFSGFPVCVVALAKQLCSDLQMVSDRLSRYAMGSYGKKSFFSGFPVCVVALARQLCSDLQMVSDRLSSSTNTLCFQGFLSFMALARQLCWDLDWSCLFYIKHETINQCRFNVYPPFATLSNIKPALVQRLVFAVYTTSKKHKLSRCWFNVGPALQMVDQH